MTYYRAKCDAYDIKTEKSLFEDELLTKWEKDKFFPSLSDNSFTAIDIPKHKTYKTFGIRFQIEDDAVERFCIEQGFYL